MFDFKLLNYLELVNAQTPEYEGVTVDNDFYKLPIDENTKPCLYLKINLPSVEFDAMLAMNLFSSTINNMVTFYNDLHNEIQYTITLLIYNVIHFYIQIGNVYY